MTRRDFLHAIQMYEQAIEIDPRYALAYAGIADAYSFLFRYSNALPENIAQAERASLRAVESDPDSAEAPAPRAPDRQSVGMARRESVRVDLGVCGITKKN